MLLFYCISILHILSPWVYQVLYYHRAQQDWVRTPVHFLHTDNKHITILTRYTWHLLWASLSLTESLSLCLSLSATLSFFLSLSLNKNILEKIYQRGDKFIWGHKSTVYYFSRSLTVCVCVAKCFFFLFHYLCDAWDQLDRLDLTRTVIIHWCSVQCLITSVHGWATWVSCNVKKRKKNSCMHQKSEILLSQQAHLSLF